MLSASKIKHPNALWPEIQLGGTGGPHGLKDGRGSVKTIGDQKTPEHRIALGNAFTSVNSAAVGETLRLGRWSATHFISVGSAAVQKTAHLGQVRRIRT